MVILSRQGHDWRVCGNVGAIARVLSLAISQLRPSKPMLGESNRVRPYRQLPFLSHDWQDRFEQPAIRLVDELEQS